MAVAFVEHLFEQSAGPAVTRVAASFVARAAASSMAVALQRQHHLLATSFAEHVAVAIVGL